MILKVRNEQGEFVDIPSIVGPKGDIGPKPEKGVDYFTQDDINAMIQEIIKQIGDNYFVRKEDFNG